MHLESMHEAPAGRDLGSLTHAFEAFTAATARLEHEYALLQARLARLTDELEEKNRLLAESVAREKALEAEALRRSRLAAMGEMAAMLAHEVRNPLGAMELFTGLLLQDLRDRPDSLRCARQVARGIADLNHLVTNLLEFTRSRTPSVQRIDCCAIVEDALHYGVEVGGAPNVVVERVYADATVPAVADPHLLRPTLLNLVRNAVQAMPDGGRLGVAVRPEGRGTQIDISDTGAGIAEKDLESIFRPFFTTRKKGTGLGLAVARELVEAMGGRLDVRSEEGKGATFSVWLPVEER